MGKKWVKEIESREVKGRLIENITFETFAQKIEKSWKVRDGDTWDRGTSLRQEEGGDQWRWGRGSGGKERGNSWARWWKRWLGEGSKSCRTVKAVVTIRAFIQWRVLPFVGFKQRNSNWLMFLRDFSRCCIENEPRGSSIETWKSGDYGNNPSERGWCPGRMGAEMVRSCQILDIFCRLSQEEFIGEYENLCY